jgi:putative ABC transport system ATP-binding protein
VTEILQIRELEFGWAPAHPLLRIDELTVKRGERVFVHGSSGSGKSTLLNLLAGVMAPQRGRLRVLGHDLPALAPAVRDAFRADHCGIIFQMFNLIPYLSMTENVMLPCRFSVRRRAHVETRGGATAEAHRLLQHLDLAGHALRERAVTRLSVGQQQRVAAARALIGAPELVLADEPTSALDSDRREAFLRLLFRECEAQDATLIFVSHDLQLRPLFDRVIELPGLNRVAVPEAD